MNETFLLECNEARYFSLDILSLGDMGCCMFGFFILPNRSCVFFTELCELYPSRMRSVKFDRGDVMRSRNGWPLKVTFQSSPPAVSRGITGCFAIQNIGEVSRSDGGVKEISLAGETYQNIIFHPYVFIRQNVECDVT